MTRGKKFTAEQIIAALREAEVGLAQPKNGPLWYSRVTTSPYQA